MTPVKDMVVLDPFNTRSIAFQIFAVKEHLSALPTLVEDGMMEEPRRITLSLATRVEIEEAQRLDTPVILGLEQDLLRLSTAVADRYFLQGANATPNVKMAGLA